MRVRRRECLVSAIIPLFLVIIGSVSLWLLFFTMFFLYFYLKGKSFFFSSLVVLRIFDVTISILIFLLIIGLLNSALLIVANDGGFSIPFFSSGLFKMVIIFVSIVYYFGSLVFFSIFSFLGKEFVMPLSIRAFEKLLGDSVVENR